MIRRSAPTSRVHPIELCPVLCSPPSADSVRSRRGSLLRQQLAGSRGRRRPENPTRGTAVSPILSGGQKPNQPNQMGNQKRWDGEHQGPPANDADTPLSLVLDARLSAELQREVLRTRSHPRLFRDVRVGLARR